MSGELFSIVVCVNNDEVLAKNLLLSPELQIRGRHQLLVQRGYATASTAFNAAFDRAEHDIVIFVHQDVLLPETWFGDLERSLAWLRATDPAWGVLGCYGSKKNYRGGFGRVYTRGVGPDGRLLDRPEAIDTLDEIVLVLRKSSGLRFDPLLPHFHMYGTDICMTAKARGLVSYAIQAFCVHNTNQLLILPEEFYECYRYVRRKWFRYLPIQTSCIRISRLNLAFHLRRLIEAKQRRFGMRTTPARRVDDPRVYCNERS